MVRIRCVLLAAIVLTTGCGYSPQALIDPQYRTVYVDTFDNHSWRRGFEYGLSRALVNEINLKTDLRIVNRDVADTIITGQIREFRQHVLVEDADDNVRELQLTMVVDMTWTDRRTGRAIRTVRAHAAHEQVKFDLGETLEGVTGEMFHDVAEELVEKLEADW